MLTFVLPFIHNFPALSLHDFLFLSAIILSAVLFLIFIFIKNSNFTSVHYVSSERPRIPMASVCNPFTFEVNLNDASFKGVICAFSSSKNCHVLLLWGVPIFPLFEFLNLPWRSMKSIIDSPTQSHFLSECTAYLDPFILNSEERRTTVLQPPAGYDENEISCKKVSGRLRYPLVVVMVLQNNSDVQENIMIAMATALHLPDSCMKTKPYIIGQFLKPESGAVGFLRKTYLSSSESVNQSGETVNLCTICYNNVISLVILPCCHACICNTCFELCENCPICRRRAFSYFELSVSNR